MHNIPITVVDDFLDNPQAFLDLALSCDYASPKNRAYPGRRTRPLQQTYPQYMSYLNRQIASLFFSDKSNISVKADSFFYVVDEYKGKGWIHQDWSAMTAILYLTDSSDNLNRGTSLFKLKKDKLFLFDNQKEIEWYDSRFKQFKGENLTKEEEKIKQDWEDRHFEKVMDIPNKFNRLIIFDPNYFHSANYLDPDPEYGKRMSFISFIHSVKSNELYPIQRYKTTPQL